ncbi:MAG: hypothetical protein KAI17_03235 [Thiotrichaceae bacterium]|nr:hypothetical protein [Thiotrichaceae bacterium]
MANLPHKKRLFNETVFTGLRGQPFGSPIGRLNLPTITGVETFFLVDNLGNFILDNLGNNIVVNT